MFGTIGNKEGVLEPWTLAGPAEGIVEKVGYSCDLDYPVSLTNGPAGIGYVGQSAGFPITFNPNCLICCVTDPDTGEVTECRMGVLKVDCIVSCDIQGADCACYVYYNAANSNLNYEVPIWSNTDDADGYRFINHSGGYPLSYNPIAGTLSAECFNATCEYKLGNSVCLTPGSFCFNGNMVMTNGTKCWTFCCDGYLYGNTSGKHNGTLAADEGQGQVPLMGYNDGTDNDIIPKKIPGVYYCTSNDTTYMCTIGADEVCVSNIICASDICHNCEVNICQDNGDTCSFIYLCNGKATICGCSGIEFCSNDITLPYTKVEGVLCVCGGICACCSPMRVNDIIFCEGGHIYCNGEASLCCISLSCPDTPWNSVWNGNTYVPTATCISNWLQNYGFVRTWRSGNILYMCTNQA